MKWRVNFQIPNSNYNIVGRALSAFIRSIPKKNGVQLFTQWYCSWENFTLTAYVPVPVIDAVCHWIKDKIITEPAWAEKIHQECELFNRRYFAYAKKIAGLDYGKMKSVEIFKKYEKLTAWQVKSHSHAISTTWFVDSNGEDFSNYLRWRLSDYLKGHGLDDKNKVIGYFIILTTPYRPSFTRQEQIEFLYLLKAVLADPKAVAIIKKFSDKEIMNKLSVRLQNKISAHYQKWCWTPYGYIGPAYSLYHYLEELKNQIDVASVAKLIVEEEARSAKIKEQIDDLEKKLSLPPDLCRLFAIAREIIWLKDFRKYILYHGHYVLDIINSEFARRLNLSLRQVNHIPSSKFKAAVLNNQVDENELNERIRFSVIWSDEKRQRYYYGAQARAQIDALEIEPTIPRAGEGLVGTCACPGKARGLVKIVYNVADVPKVKSGDIMIARTTFPAYLPAMKKAAAIVTEDGGITCHAAIVSREFKIPCVVGAKQALSYFQNGDKAEVDAIAGIVKKL